MIKIDLSGATPFLGTEELSTYKAAEAAHKSLCDNTCGYQYTGWLRLPETFSPDELMHIKSAAKKIQSDSAALVVVGIGGSYLGARAAIELLHSPNYNSLPKETPDVFFAGNNLSGKHLSQLKDLLGDRDFSVNVISKSGTTLEPAIAFRFIRELLAHKYSNTEIKQRIYVTTDSAHGPLRELALREGYESFVIPEDIGGRYSILTSVGLLPMAVSGLDVEKVLLGAKKEMAELMIPSEDNAALIYASARQHFYSCGKKIEVLAYFDPSLRFFGEWWKQLFGESEGKNKSGIFPASVEFPADLHSLGQYIQDGERTLMETIISYPDTSYIAKVPHDETNFDNLNYISGRDIGDINSCVKDAAKLAHSSGGVPVMEIVLDAISEESFGSLVYFCEFACAVSGIMSGVDPFVQPGVEEYKKNMYKLLKNGR